MVLPNILLDEFAVFKAQKLILKGQKLAAVVAGDSSLSVGLKDFSKSK